MNVNQIQESLPNFKALQAKEAQLRKRECELTRELRKIRGQLPEGEKGPVSIPSDTIRYLGYIQKLIASVTEKEAELEEEKRIRRIQAIEDRAGILLQQAEAVLSQSTCNLNKDITP